MFTLTTPTKPLPMDTLPKLRHSNFSLNHHRSSFPTPLTSSLSCICLPPRHPPSPPFRFPSIRASSSPSPSANDPSFHKPKTSPSFPPLLQTLAPLLSPVVETTCIVIAATAFFFMRFHHKPVIAAPLSPPTVETETAVSEETEKALEERLINNPGDTEALHALMECKIRARKIDEAIGVLDRLIEVEPEEFEWPLLKANMHIYNDNHELAREIFEDILKKDPLRVEAFHGLVMATSESNEPLKELLKRVEGAMEECKKQKKDSDVRDFRLLLAQIKVMEGNFYDALNAYQELVEEEPRDFRPYLCQGIIYTLLRKKDEAQKQFDKFRRLVPKNHPYKEYFEDNMFATQFFAQKLEREGAGARG